MGTRPPRPAAIAVAAAFALSVFGFTLVFWLAFGGTVPLQAKGYRFHALFGQEAVNVVPNSDVRIAGVTVGRVVETSQRSGHTDVLIQMEPRYAPVRRDARMILRSKTLLGEAFLEMSPGSRRAPEIRDGGTLPLSHIRAAQGIEQVLGSFDAPTRRDFKKFLRDFSLALKGRGEDLNATIGNSGPTLQDLDRLVRILDDQRPALHGLIRDTGAALRAIADRQDALRSLVTAGNDVFGTTAARNRELTATVRELPPFLVALRGTLASLEGTGDALAPTLRALRPVAPLVRPGLEGANQLAPELKAVFRGVRPVTRAARKGLPALSRLIKAVNPLNDALSQAGPEIVPVLQLIAAYRYELVAAFTNAGAANQASVPRASGGPLHTLRALIPIGNENLVGYAQRLASNRHNPYIRPGGLADLLTGRGLDASDCRNTSNPQTVPVIGTGAPPCHEQQPWEFQGEKRSFPHVQRSR
jgi:virulence factor Mce-like protein